MQKEIVPLETINNNLAPEKQAFILYNVFTEEECKQLIEIGEQLGYKVRDPSSVHSNNYHKRAFYSSTTWAKYLYDRISPYLPSLEITEKKEGEEKQEIVTKYIPHSCDSLLRILRYNSGEHFPLHVDGTNYLGSEEQEENKKEIRSFFTAQIYLNEEYEGGQTTFWEEELPKTNNRRSISLTSKTGMVLIFWQDYLHSGKEVTKGTKYTIRTDIFYQST